MCLTQATTTGCGGERIGDREKEFFFESEQSYRFIDKEGHSGFGFRNKPTVCSPPSCSQTGTQPIVVTYFNGYLDKRALTQPLRGPPLPEGEGCLFLPLGLPPMERVARSAGWEFSETCHRTYEKDR